MNSNNISRCSYLSNNMRECSHLISNTKDQLCILHAEKTGNDRINNITAFVEMIKYKLQSYRYLLLLPEDMRISKIPNNFEFPNNIGLKEFYEKMELYIDPNNPPETLPQLMDLISIYDFPEYKFPVNYDILSFALEVIKLNEDVPLIFSGLTFVNDFIFDNLDIKQELGFINCIFKRDVRISKTVFRNVVEFNSCECPQSKNKTKSNFNFLIEKVRFEKSVHFSKNKFNEFEATNLSLLKSLHFSLNTFKKDSIFSYVDFSTANTIFMKINEEDKHYLNFYLCNLDGVFFTECNMSKIIFENSNITSALFIASNWDEEKSRITNFFKELKSILLLAKKIVQRKNNDRGKGLSKIKKMHQAFQEKIQMFHLNGQGSRIVGGGERKYYSRMDGTRRDFIQYDEDCYRQLKVNMDCCKDYRIAHKFYVSELEMKLKNKRTTKRYKAFLRIYRLVSGYGNKPGRAVVVSFLIIMILSLGLVGKDYLVKDYGTFTTKNNSSNPCYNAKDSIQAVAIPLRFLSPAAIPLENICLIISFLPNKPIPDKKNGDTDKNPHKQKGNQNNTSSIGDWFSDLINITLYNITSVYNSSLCTFKIDKTKINNYQMCYILLIQYFVRPILIALIILPIKRKFQRG